MTQPVRPLTAEEDRAYRLARLVAAEQMPYFMRALFAAAPVAAPGLGTFAVDRWWRLYADPALLLDDRQWNPAARAGALLHEALHLLGDHAGRADALPQPYRHLAWNYATDAENNDGLLAAGVTLPAGVVTPAALGCADNGLAEDYYAALVPPGGPDLPDPGDGDPGCGSGAGGPAVPGELGQHDTVAAGIDQAEGGFVRRQVALDVTAHVAVKGRGSVPAGLDRWAARVLAPPTVPWDRVLRAAVRRAVGNRAGRTDYTYARPGRRRVPGLVTPAMRGPAVAVSLVVDTSGSMSPADLDAALGEVKGVLRSCGVARELVRLVSCDAAATTAQQVRSAEAVRLVGGGGTDMRVGITAAEAARPAPHVVVVLTDGDTPWPDAPTRAALVCGVISTSPPRGTPPWATTVHIPPAA